MMIITLVIIIDDGDDDDGFCFSALVPRNRSEQAKNGLVVGSSSSIYLSIYGSLFFFVDVFHFFILRCFLAAENSLFLC